MAPVRVGVIGGSGLGEALGALGGGETVDLETPFGRPSGPITLTEVGGVPVALLSRHGRGHRLPPHRVPSRANIFALKQLGVSHIFASGAVGSLREEIGVRSLVVPDQVIDRTSGRPSTFFDDLAVHVELASPFCPSLRGLLRQAASLSPMKFHDGGTYVCMQGPQFSTRAESELHRSWGGSVIGMTAMPEAKLAREAEVCYALVALPTDYDCWRPHPADLPQARLLEEIIGNIRAATQNALDLIRRAIAGVPELAQTPCRCGSALALGVWTDRGAIPPEARERLKPLLGKYFQENG